MNEKYTVALDKTNNRLKGVSPTAKSLRKTSKIVQNWKEVLEFAQIQKHQNNEKQSKFKKFRDCFKIIKSLICLKKHK